MELPYENDELLRAGSFTSWTSSIRSDLESYAMTSQPDQDLRQHVLKNGMTNGRRSVTEYRTNERLPASARSRDYDILVVSALYAKLLVVLGVSLPLSEVISPLIPSSFYMAFYLYLYLGSIAFLLYAYFFLLRRRGTAFSVVQLMFKKNKAAAAEGAKHFTYEAESGSCGSFYLRVGAIAFGIGSMIYSGLEFVQFFEFDPNAPCYRVVFGIKPVVHLAFTFAQLYFIFLNSKMRTYKYKNVARFGLMHMLATNLCVWLMTVIQESKFEILRLADHPSILEDHEPGHPGSLAENLPHDTDNVTMIAANVAVELLETVIGATSWPSPMTPGATVNPLKRVTRCRRMRVLGQLVQNISPLLFPCTIQYSLISAAICYIMWKNIKRPVRGRVCSTSSAPGLQLQLPTVVVVRAKSSNGSVTPPSPLYQPPGGEDNQQQHTPPHVEMDHLTPPPSPGIHGPSYGGHSRRNHHYRVDCTNSIKGLFTGILVLVLVIISVILYFVLIHMPDYRHLAIASAHMSEIIMYLLTMPVPVLAYLRLRSFRYQAHGNVELDNILLIFAQAGVYLFSIFSMVGGHLSPPGDNSWIMVFGSSVARLVQATLQTVFILDASQRSARTALHEHTRPAREMITFLLVCNFAMWIIGTLETGRADSHPLQLKFYGFWGWTIISRFCSPLAIFFRFHSTVCLCEIWKRLYKPRILPVS